ncbi:MAG: ankyrin repeat domain-containing protein [Parachlamydiaceae bacterium]|nr:ankyrin repeat domain-containing protein [Parachlamydiaceae bacterium]
MSISSDSGALHAEEKRWNKKSDLVKSDQKALPFFGKLRTRIADAIFKKSTSKINDVANQRLASISNSGDNSNFKPGDRLPKAELLKSYSNINFEISSGIDPESSKVKETFRSHLTGESFNKNQIEIKETEVEEIIIKEQDAIESDQTVSIHEKLEDKPSLNEEQEINLSEDQEINDFRQKIEFLIEKGDVDHVDNKGISALMYAILKKDFYSAELLIKNGANVNLKDKKECTALIYALKIEKFDSIQLELVKLLINNKAIIDDSISGGLFKAIHEEKYELIQLLIENKIDVNVSRYFGYTARLLLKHMYKPQSFKEFIDTQDVKLTNIDKQYKLLKLVGQVTSLTSKFTLGSKKIYFEGLQPELSSMLYSQIKKNLQNFAKYEKNIQLLPLDLLTQALEVGLNSTEVSVDHLIELYDANIPLIFNVGYSIDTGSLIEISAHVVNIVIWKDYLILSNRGGGLENGHKTYKIPKSANLKDHIEAIQKLKTEKEYKDYFSTLNFPLENDFNKQVSSLPLQISGNCSYASLEGALFMISQLNIWNNVDKSQINNQLNDNRKIFLRFQQFQIKEYLRRIDELDPSILSSRARKNINSMIKRLSFQMTL